MSSLIKWRSGCDSNFAYDGSGSVQLSGAAGDATEIYFGNGTNRQVGAMLDYGEHGVEDFLMIGHSAGAVLLSASNAVQVEAGGGEDGFTLIGTP